MSLRIELPIAGKSGVLYVKTKDLLPWNAWALAQVRDAAKRYLRTHQRTHILIEDEGDQYVVRWRPKRKGEN